MKNSDRVRENTPEAVNIRLDEEMAGRIRVLKERDPQDISKRISELENEWDVERYLEMHVPILALSGIALGAFYRKRWFILPAVVLTFLLQHSIQGWCPPVPLLRYFGVRTRKEIEKEKYALKALRGDFNGVGLQSTAHEAVKAVEL